MDVTERKPTYSGTHHVRLSTDGENLLRSNGLLTLHAPQDFQKASVFWQAYSAGMEGRAEYFQLHNVLVDYMWSAAGEGDGKEAVV